VSDFLGRDAASALVAPRLPTEVVENTTRFGGADGTAGGIDCHEQPASLNAGAIVAGLVGVVTRLREQPGECAGGSANNCARNKGTSCHTEGRGEPSRGHEWPDARDGKSRQSEEGTGSGTGEGTLGGPFPCVARVAAVARGSTAVAILGNDRNGVILHTQSAEFVDGGFGIRAVIKKGGYSVRHKQILPRIETH
jgi:hypothetical protein